MTSTEQLMGLLSDKDGSQASVFDYLKGRLVMGDYTTGSRPCRDIDELVRRADLNTTHKVIQDLAHYDLIQTAVAPEVMRFINSPKRLLEKAVYGDHDDKFSKLFKEMERRR